MKKDTPMLRLSENGVNFKCKSDETMCGAKMVYSYVLKEKEQEEFKLYDDLLQLVHFSDYEGMSDDVSGRAKSVEIANVAFNKAILYAPDHKARENLHKLLDIDMALYLHT